MKERCGQYPVPLTGLENKGRVQASPCQERADTGRQETGRRSDPVELFAGKDGCEYRQKPSGQEREPGCGTAAAAGRRNSASMTRGARKSRSINERPAIRPLKGALLQTEAVEVSMIQAEMTTLEKMDRRLRSFSRSRSTLEIGVRPTSMIWITTGIFARFIVPGVFEALLADLFDSVPRKFESFVGMRFAVDHADDLEAHAVRARENDVAP